MTRGISAGMQAAIAANVARPVFLFSAEFASSTIYLNSISKNLSFNAQTWLGNGLLYGIEGIEEAMETRSIGWKVELTGADSALISLVLGSGNQSKVGTVYLGLLDSDEVLITDPEQIAVGYFDYAQIEEDGVQSRIILNYETELQGMRRIQEFRYSHFSQQAIFPGDLGFEYTAAAEEWSGFWGRAAKTPKLQKKRRTAK